MGKHYVNWHLAAVCAVKIELRGYSHLLDFYSEYVLGKNNYRIDLLIVHKLPGSPIPKNIARIFGTYNLFEIKGLGSSLTTDAYYKTNGYAGLLIDSCGKKNQYTRQNISLTFLSSQRPRKLFKHLTKDCGKILEKSSPGIYHIKGEMYGTQVLVTKELPPEENLYLHCLRRYLSDPLLAKQLSDDYQKHQNEDIYIKYMDQLVKASINKEGESSMVCEGILNICGTSSKEIREKAFSEAKAIYVPQIEQLEEENARQLAEIKYLKAQLAVAEKNG